MKTRGSILLMALFLLVAVSTSAFLWQKILLEDSEQVTFLHARVQADQNVLAAFEYGQALVRSGEGLQEPARIELPGGSAEISIVSEGQGRGLRVVVHTRWKRTAFTSTATRSLEGRP